MKVLRCILGASCLNAWLWLVVRCYGGQEFFLFNDESGRLITTVVWGSVFLLLMGLAWQKVHRGAALGTLWNLACVALMTPLLAGLHADAPSLGDSVISAVAGFGFAVAFIITGLNVAQMHRKDMLKVAGGSIAISVAFIEGLLLLAPQTLALLPVVLALLLRLCLNAPSAEAESENEEQDAPAAAPSAQLTRPWLTVCIFSVYGFTGLGFGLYLSMRAVLNPLQPLPDMALLSIIVVSALCSPLCIFLARRGSLWRSILLTGPLLMVGYTAWPLLHRESPALSLHSLHFAYTLLAVYCLTTLFYATCWLNAHRAGKGLFHLGLGGAVLLICPLLGSEALPYIRQSFSQGVTVNYIFVLLSINILIASSTFVLLLQRITFWRPLADPLYGPPVAAPTAPSQEHGATAQENLPPEEQAPTGLEPEIMAQEECEQIFRQMGLTRQQACIAAMLARKKQDTDICDALNISVSTLKTHIRNILHRLNINSRYELPWLVSRAAAILAVSPDADLHCE